MSKPEESKGRGGDHGRETKILTAGGRRGCGSVPSPHEAGYRERQGVLDRAIEDRRRDQCVEDPAEDPADADPQVELGEAIGRGSAAC